MHFLKSSLTVLFVALLHEVAHSQAISINSTGNAADAQSILDVSSTSKGVLLPRMSTAQRLAVAPTNGSDKGMLVYDTNTESFWYWDGTANTWREVPNTSNTGDITSVTAGDGLTGGGTTGAVTLTAAANNGLNVDAAADRIQLGGTLTEATTISLGGFDMTYDLSSTGNFVIQDGGVPHFQIDNNDGNAFLGADFTVRDGSTVGTTLLDITDAGVGGNDGLLRVYTDGSVNHSIAGDGDVVFNELGTVRNFRVESDNEINMLKVDGTNDRIGIGVASPSAQLHTSGTLRFANYANGFLQVDGTGNVSVATGSSLFTAGNGLSWSGTTLNSVWTQNGNEIYNNNSANVGIGVTAPGKKLHVQVSESSGNSFPLLVRNQGASNNNGSGVGIGFNVHSGGTLPKTAIYNERLGDYGAPSKLHFLMSTVADAGTEVSLSDSRMTILSTGNVGIGTTNPSERLHVAGDVKINGGGGTIGGTNINNGWLVIGDNASSGVGIDNNELYFTGIDANFGVLGNNNMSVNINGSTRMFFQADGNIGIGTNSPDYKLQLAGDFVPETDVTYDLGKSSLRWRNLYVDNIVQNNLTQGSVVFAGTGGALSEDNANFFFDDSNNRLGLGTSSPSSVFHISNSPSISNVPLAIFESTAGVSGGVGEGVEVRSYRPATVYSDKSSSARDFRLGADASVFKLSIDSDDDDARDANGHFDDIPNAMVVDGSGNIGIGASPFQKFDVVGTLYTRAAPTATIDAEQIRFGRADSDIRYHSINTLHTGGASGNYMQFKVHDGGGTPYLSQTTVMTLLGDGNVGVGVTAPTAQLHTTGTVRLQGVGSTASNTQILTRDANGNLAYRNAGSWTYAGQGDNLGNHTATTTLDMGGSSILFNDTDYRGIYFGEMYNDALAHSSDWGYIRQSAANGQLEIGSDAVIDFYETDGRTHRIQFDLNSGEAGFGTNSPDATVDVEGDFRITGENSKVEFNTKEVNNGWTLIYRDDFESGLDGWNMYENNSSSTTSTEFDRESFGIVGLSTNLNNYNKGSDNDNVFKKTYDMSGITWTQAMVTFDYLFIDSWDGRERGYAGVSSSLTGNPAILWVENHDNNDDTNGRIDYNWTGTNASYGDQARTATLRLNNNMGGNFVLIIGSTLGSDTSDESFGIDNVEVWVR